MSVQRYGQIEIEWGIKEVSLLDRREMAIDVCKRYMVDFREIFRADWHETGMPGLLPRELITRPVTSRAFIEAQLAKPFHGTTVVLTHHAPSPRSLDPKFHAQETNAAFASDLTPTIQNGKPDLWVHGHIHRFVDYYEGCTGSSATRADIHTSERKMVSRWVLSSISSQTERDAHRQRGEKMFSAVIASIPAVHSVDTSL